VIPCHRVVREDKSLGGYRWGLQRKEELLAHEQRQLLNTKD
jgi:AraC family transcriptional regulator, regulatory protein of adaptative response / methylated-DNA-[protein]-cysteine methyltransferase